MRSLFSTALCLSLIHTSVAHVPHSFRDLIQRDSMPEPTRSPGLLSGLSNWFGRVFGKGLSTRQSNDGICYEDSYYYFVQDDLGPTFCQEFIQYANVTSTIDYTPTSTYTDIFTTRVRTAYQLSRVTPRSTVTVTVTVGPPIKRNVEAATITPRALSQVEIREVFQMFRRQNGAADSDDALMSSAFSSACSCQDYSGPTEIVTYTDEAVVTTLSAFKNLETTVRRTTTAIPIVDSTTVTVGAGAPTSLSTSSSLLGTAGYPSTQTSTSSAATTPTAGPFTCPDDNNTINSEMVGNERFDFLILCDTVLTDENFYGGSLSYDTFGECAGACSVANQNFDSPVCQGVSFYATSNSANGNCFLKKSANDTMNTPGVDSALLQRILLGVFNGSAQGTSTESAPFASTQSTQDPSSMSSAMSSMMSNSSTSMPMVTPIHTTQSGLRVQAPVIAYSTYVSGGSTYSTGSQYSFSTQYSNGSWVFYYYTSYTEAWTSATTVFVATETGLSVQNSTNSETQLQSGNDGDYSIITTTNTTTDFLGGYNVTEVISNQTYANNGREIASSATTLNFSYETGLSSSGSGSGSTNSTNSNSTSGNSSGGSGSGASGGPGSSSPATSTSTSVFSTHTVVVNSGGSMPSFSETVIINTYGTAFSSGLVVSGQNSADRTGGASSLMESGGPSFTPLSLTVNSFGTEGSSGFVISGGPTDTGSATSTAASSGPSPSGTFSNGSVHRSPGSESTSPSTIPVFSSNDGGYYRPGNAPSRTTETGTSLGSFSNTAAPRRPGSGSAISTYTSTTTITSPPGSLSNGYGDRSGDLYSSPTPHPHNSTTESSPTAHSPSSTSPTFTGDPRSGFPGSSKTSTGTRSTGPTTCGNATMGTTTIWSVTTMLGCYSSCPPWGGGDPHGWSQGPQTFGPSVWTTET